VTGQGHKPEVIPEVKIIILGDMKNLDELELEKMTQLQSPNWLKGYYLFQCFIWKVHQRWAEDWHACLDQIDQCVNFKAEDIMNAETIEELMFDDSFTRSKLYFQTLQLLRLFSNLISETGQDLDNDDLDLFTEDVFARMRQCWGSEASKDIDILESNWEIVMKHQKELEKKLLSRIESKTAEVLSLRDGLFNATSVREASRSTSMNRSVFVFTIVTVTYLPASFIATIFGTQMFNDAELASTINKFKITTVVVSITTFFVAFILVLLAGRIPRLQRSSVYRKAKMALQVRLWFKQAKPKFEKEEEQREGGEGSEIRQTFHKGLHGIVNCFRRKSNKAKRAEV